MGIVFVLLPLSLLLAALAVSAFRWAVADGQLDDLDGASFRALFGADADADADEDADARSRPSGEAR